LLRLHPGDDLSRDAELRRDARNHLSSPGPRGDDELPAGEVARGGADFDRASVAFPIKDLRLGEDRRASADRLFREEQDAPFGRHESRVRLLETLVLRRQRELRESPRGFVFGERLDLDVVLVCRLVDPFHRVAGRLAEVQKAGLEIHLRSRLLLEQLPILIRALEERNVVRVLGVRLPDDPALAQMGSEFMRDVELLEPQNPIATLRQEVARGRPHRADAEHDDVEGSPADLLLRQLVLH